MMGTAAFSARVSDFGAEFSMGDGTLWLDVRKVIRVWVVVCPAKESRWDAWTDDGDLEICLGRLHVIITPRAALLKELESQPDPAFRKPAAGVKGTKRPPL